MKAFRVSGHFEMGQNKRQQFTKQLAAADMDAVRERVYSDLGSRHGVGRRKISIDQVDEITGDQITDPVVRYQSGA